MDTQAAARARRRAIKEDLSEAYTEEEACPPEWVDLLAIIRSEAASLRDDISAETRFFVEVADIRTALTRRERVSTQLRVRAEELNTHIRRLNDIAPHPRFTRAMLDIDEALRPLYRSRREPKA